MSVGRLEGIIICKDYSDFLAETLPQNLEYFDHLVVVSHWSDRATIDLCNRYSVTCVQTHAFQEDGQLFNKGKAINVGIAHLKSPDWILHIDADVVLPFGFRQMLARSHLKKENLYGADRFNVYGYEAWERLKPELVPHHQSHYFVEPVHDEKIHFGARIIHHDHNYVPIGYFQLWSKEAGKRYPTGEGTAEHSDVLFAIQWTYEQRRLLPSVFVYHLESTDGPKPMGANWHGRKTPLFQPRVKPHHPHHKPPYCPKGEV